MKPIAMGWRFRGLAQPTPIAAVLGLVVLGAVGVSAAAPAAEQVLTACMKVELPSALGKLGIDPLIRTREDAGALAYASCRRVATLCAEAQESEGCVFQPIVDGVSV